MIPNEGTPPPMNCPPPEDLLAMLDLPEGHPKALDLEAHVSTCADCQGHLSAQTASWKTLEPRLPRLDSRWEALRKEFGYQRVVETPSSFADSSEPFEPETGTDIPAHIGSFRIEGTIATGGMGLVLHGRKDDSTSVAIKLIRPQAGMERLVDRFRLEVGLMRGLTHPHLVAALDHGEWQGQPFLVMERLDGVDLSSLEKRLGAISPPDACELVREAALAVAYIHSQGVIHRDIKPSNLMLARCTDGEYRVKLLDLGLARLIDGAQERGLTVTGQVMGTYDYMAPEQAVSSRRVDERADVYSLGASLWKLLSGLTLSQMHPHLVLNGNVLPGSSLPVALLRLVARMTDHAPEKRPTDPGDVVRLQSSWIIEAVSRHSSDSKQFTFGADASQEKLRHKR